MGKKRLNKRSFLEQESNAKRKQESTTNKNHNILVLENRKFVF